jgi:hypothetical protein
MGDIRAFSGCGFLKYNVTQVKIIVIGSPTFALLGITISISGILGA